MDSLKSLCLEQVSKNYRCTNVLPLELEEEVLLTIKSSFLKEIHMASRQLLIINEINEPFKVIVGRGNFGITALSQEWTHEVYEHYIQNAEYCKLSSYWVKEGEDYGIAYIVEKEDMEEFKTICRASFKEVNVKEWKSKHPHIYNRIMYLFDTVGMFN
jgi:hypothetical protein